jgi:type IV pilus assembly protein PilY1
MTGNDTSNIVLLESMANQGHGRYFAATSTTALRDALETVFKEVQSVNSVFSSVTLPVAVNVRGTNLNQVYLGNFRPDPDATPRWFGNLKEYQLAFNSNTNKVYLADVNGLAVESPGSGFVVDDAISYWTSSSTFWSYAPSGNPPSASDSPDGPVVEKGGVAQRIRALYPNPDSTARADPQNLHLQRRMRGRHECGARHLSVQYHQHQPFGGGQHQRVRREQCRRSDRDHRLGARQG